MRRRHGRERAAPRSVEREPCGDLDLPKTGTAERVEKTAALPCTPARACSCCRLRSMPPPLGGRCSSRHRWTRIVQVTTVDGETQTLLLDASRVRPGERLRYTIEFTNTSNEYIGPGIIVITNPIPEGAEYLEGTAAGDDTRDTLLRRPGCRIRAPREPRCCRGRGTNCRGAQALPRPFNGHSAGFWGPAKAG